ncbi:MAG: phosphonate ABC transporter, permease protein PhnE [Planctomycetota bacterium]
MSQIQLPHPAAANSPSEWKLRQPYSKKLIFGLLVGFVVLGWSFQNVELDRGVKELMQAVGYSVGLAETSQVATGATNYVEKGWPLVLSKETPVLRLEDFDRNNLPWLSHLETRTEIEPEFDTDAMRMINHEVTTEYLVQPIGYLGRVVMLMIETIEMAFWGTVIAVLVAIPLTFFGAKNYTPWIGLYHLSRGICSFNRAMPELITALFFVLMFGFGPIAGMVALGLHTSGLLGKFFADDIENADPGPQMALASTGAGKLKVIRFAVLPQVLPQFVAYVQYILERNVRTATVLGIVGAGGIGLELKGRWDMFAYGHVTTILLAIFVTVYLLECMSQYLRKRLIDTD